MQHAPIHCPNGVPGSQGNVSGTNFAWLVHDKDCIIITEQTISIRKNGKVQKSENGLNGDYIYIITPVKTDSIFINGICNLQQYTWCHYKTSMEMAILTVSL